MTAGVLARVVGTGGQTAVLVDDGPVLVGRDPSCALAFPDEARLSRRAALISWNGVGVLVTNLSRAHGLVVDADGSVSRLPVADETGPVGGYVLGHGSATVTGPAWGPSPFSVTVTVQRDRVDAPPALAVPVTGDATREGLRLRTGTKEFVTALALCHHRLLDAADPTPPPPVPVLTRHVLESTNSWHLLREYDTDEATRARLSGRVHEHLKALRVKIVRSGLAERGTRLTPAMMVDLLVGSGAVTRSHLALLEDEAWLRHQEEQWWGS